MRVLIVLLIVSMFAGCAGPEVEPAAPTDAGCGDDAFCASQELLDDAGRDLRTDLLATDRLDAPEWNVGDVFEQHMFFGNQDREGRHIKTIVIETSSQGSVIATSDPEAASFDAVYDYPILGDIGPELETGAFGTDWSWMYQWPLTDGLTWTGEIDGLVNWNSYNFEDFELTLAATYDGAIDTPKGDFPGFWIDGTTADGDLLLRYNYVPMIGWFSHFWIYDLETGDADDVQFHAMSMGTSTNYTGEYFLATAEEQIEHFYGHFPNPDSPDRTVQGDPAPQTFTIPEGADRMMGIVVPIAVAGQTEVQFTEPDTETRSYEYQQFDLDGDGFTVYWVDEEAEQGSWEARIVPGAAFAGAWIWITSVDLELLEM